MGEDCRLLSKFVPDRDLGYGRGKLTVLGAATAMATSGAGGDFKGEEADTTKEEGDGRGKQEGRGVGRGTGGGGGCATKGQE